MFIVEMINKINIFYLTNKGRYLIMLFENYKKSMEKVYKEYNKGTLHKVEMPSEKLMFHMMMGFEAYLQQEAKEGNEYYEIEVIEDDFPWGDVFGDMFDD